VILAFDETKQIVPELKAQGWDLSKTYLVDGNTADYSKDFEAGTLNGAQGTIPGAQPDPEFKQRLVDFYKKSANADLKDFSYAPESYDAIVLAALAAEKGKGTDGPTIQANLAAVSGTTNGEKCSDYASASRSSRAARTSRTRVRRASVPSTPRTTRRAPTSASTSSTPTTLPSSRSPSRAP
jgi:branched-chain amino acid transport system substrate-binding protein